jgi:RNA polymerase sigma-70 factor (ECF subfamily)
VERSLPRRSHFPAPSRRWLPPSEQFRNCFVPLPVQLPAPAPRNVVPPTRPTQGQGLHYSDKGCTVSDMACSHPESLLKRARDGDRNALGDLLQLYTRYLELLARLQIGRRLQGKADALDLVQETFLEAHRHFARFRGESEREFVAWLRQILAGRLNLLLRRYLGTQGRNARLERELALELEQSSAVLDAGLIAPQSSPSQQAMRREQGVLLADALAQLPENYREVIVLRHLEGLPFAEVARRLGRTEDSVQKLWVRALARLRRLLGEEESYGAAAS